MIGEPMGTRIGRGVAIFGLSLVLAACSGGGDDAIRSTAPPSASPASSATATPTASPNRTATPAVSTATTATATATATVTATRTLPTATTPPSPPATTVEGPFPAAVMMPGDIDTFPGGRFTTPRPGDRVTSPLAISGLINAFEGQAAIVLRDRTGAEVTRTQAIGAMGMFGAFNVTLVAPLSEPSAPYTLEMVTASPRDGATTVIAQVAVTAGTTRTSGTERLSGGPLPAPIRLSRPRISNATNSGFDVEFVSSTMCRGGVYFPRELAGTSLGTIRTADEQTLATYHRVHIDARMFAGATPGMTYRWWALCELPETAPPSPESRVATPFDQPVR